MIGGVKVISPIGELPYWFDRFELHDGSLVIRGRLSEFDSKFIIEPSDLAALGRGVALPAAGIAGAALALVALRRSRRR
jgi:hypothetical protein